MGEKITSIDFEGKMRFERQEDRNVFQLGDWQTTGEEGVTWQKGCVSDFGWCKGDMKGVLERKVEKQV